MLDPVTLGLLGIGGLLLLLLLGVHVGIALLAVGLIGIAQIVGFPVAFSMSTSALYHTFSAYELVTLPLFVLMGYLASVGGISARVFRCANDWLGHLRGGLGVSTVASCTAFGAVCGSSIVTSSVFTRLCAPEMRKYGYDKRLAYGICGSAGMAGMLIPPSILMVIYGIFSGESIGKLLIAGIAPGLLLAALFCGVAILLARHERPAFDETQRPSLKRRLIDLLSIWQIWVVAVIIFGGSLGGVFNPTEAAAIACGLMVLIIAVTKRRQAAGLFRDAFGDAASTTCMIFLIMGGATVFSRFLALTGLPDLIVGAIAESGLSHWQLLLLIVLFYAALGCFLDSISLLSVTIPLLSPIVGPLGWDPIWYAVVVIVTVEIGLITPPVGLNVFAAYSVAEPDVKLGDIFRGVLPFLLVSVLAVAFLIAVPGFSTYLPNLLIP